MNRLSKTALLLLLVAGITAPSTSIVQAKTIEDVPTTESSILSRTADPIRVSKERLAQDDAEKTDDDVGESSDKKTDESTDESETKESSSNEIESSSDKTKESSTESSDKTTDSAKEKKKKSPKATFLREGNYGDDPSTYDIDSDFSWILRNATLSSAPTGYGNFYVNIGFTGKGRAAGQLTKEDMETLTFINVGGSTAGNINSIKGIEFASELEYITFVATTHSSGKMKEANFSQNEKLAYINLNNQPLESLELSSNASSSLEMLLLRNSRLKQIDLNGFSKLIEIHIYGDFSRGILEELKLENCTSLRKLYVGPNEIRKLNIKGCTSLEIVTMSGNRISDITEAYGLNDLVSLGVMNQVVTIPVPEIIDGKATVDILKTTASAGLSVTNGDITGSPNFVIDGDKIIIENVTRADLNQHYLNFNYNSNQLSEGKIGAQTRGFGGTIEFYIVSDLKNDLKVDSTKVESGKNVSWTWNIESLTEEIAKNVKPKLELPAGLSLVSGSVKVNGSTVSDSTINGSTSLGNLAQNETKVITFETTATGTAEEWLEATGRLDWEDTTMSSPHDNESTDAVQIKDEEQTHTPQPTEEMGLLSVPIRFDYGIKDMAKTEQVFNLSPDLYQTNTNVVSKGFYTRVKDDRAAGNSTGWSLTAQLSNFVDVNDPSSGMPDSYGTALELDDMKIEAIKDRDTAQEAIDPTPTNAKPSTVSTKATLVVGETAKTLVSAQPTEGLGTWQLRIPFDKVSLKLPANAGKENSNYQAKLTWSLNDTPT